MSDDISPMQVVRPIVFSSFANTRDSDATYYNESRVLSIAAADDMRYGYDPYSGVPIGYIFESAATNELTKSNDFGDAVWVNDSFNPVTVSTSTELAPDDSFAQLISASIIPARIERDNPLTGTTTFSIHVKKKTGSGFFTMSGSGTGVFNLDSGVIVSGSEASIQRLNNDWYRCSITGTASDPLTISSTAAFEYYVFGAQLEAGTSATSFIYTNVSTETRAADITGSPPYLVDTNIPEDDYPDYDSGTTYNVGDIVMVRSTYHRNFKSLVNSNTGHFPPTNVGQWLDIGATERWRMFDMDVGSNLQSINEGTIDVTVALADKINSLTLLNVDGVTATVRMYGATTGLIYEKVVELITDPPVADWYEYYWGARRSIKTITFDGFPDDENTTVEVIINGVDETDTVKLGKLVIGYGITLGFTEQGASVGIIDYSTKEVDEFGNYFIQERPFVGKADLKIVVDIGNEDFVYDTLAEFRSIPCVYIGHQDIRSTIIHGFYGDFSVLFSTRAASYCSLSVKGI